MNRPANDRDLMFGLVAVSQQFIDADAFVETVSQWTRGDQSKSLEDVLLERGVLSESQRAEVDSILERAPDSDLSTLGPETLNTEVVEAVRERINCISDSEVRTSLIDYMTLIGPEEPRPTPNTPAPIASEQNRFHVRKELARGGLGQVFIARDKQLNRNVALKQILERWQDHPTSNHRFLTEAEITGRLEHPGVVPVYALGNRSGGRYYYAMRLIRGVTLEDEIKKFFRESASKRPAERNLELRKLLRRFVDVCNTIGYAHSRGVIHRDLKPANIMLGKYGETLVVDWGLAKQVGVEEPLPTTAESILVPGSGSGSSATRYGSALGTPQYMSPEQAAGRLDIVGPSSDIYGLGATFYHLLTGKPSQTDPSLHETLDRVKRNEFPPPRSIRADVPKPLEAICLKAMQARPSDRYSSAGDMAQDIECWLADQRVPAYREPLLFRAARFLRRHQTLAASGTVATVLLCAAAVVGSISLQRTQTRQREHEFALSQQRLQNEQEDQQRFAERRSNAEAILQFGLVEAKAGRFESALRFFRQGEQVCADERRLDDLRAKLSGPAEDMSRVVEYQRLSDEAIMAVTLQEDQRAMDLIASGLRQLGVFEDADWWDRLPVQHLSRRAADRLEKQVHLDLITLTSLLAKSVITDELFQRYTGENRSIFSLFAAPVFTKQQLLIKEATLRTEILAQTYRESQWLERVEGIGRFIFGEFAAMPDKPDWRLESFADAYYLGAMCAMATHAEKDGVGSSFFKQTLGIPDSDSGSDTRQLALLYLQRATELEPDNYLANVLLGWMQLRDNQLAAARATFGHGIALRPDLILAYDWRSITGVEQAKQSSDATQRRRLLKIALNDANAVCKLMPGFEIGYWIRGNALQEMGEDSQAVASYMEAIRHEPPAEMISTDKFILMMQQREPYEVRRLGDVLPDRFADTRRYAKQLRDREPDNPRYLILDATAALALRQWDDARDLAADTLEMVSVLEQSADPEISKIISQAYAIQGEVHRAKEEWALARDALAESLRRDRENATAADGLALVLDQLAGVSNTRVQTELALAAYENLASVGRTDWHLLRAHRGRFKLLLQQGDLRGAEAALEKALLVDRGQDLSGLTELAQQHGATGILQRLEQLNIPAQLAGVSAEDRRPKTLALRNGDFELGLDSYWEPWTSVGGCFTDASTDDATRSGGDGELSLLIRHHSDASEGSYAMLEQVLPVTLGTRYRMTVWAKSDGVAADGIRIVIDDDRDNPVIALPEGTYDWKEFSGEFSVPGEYELEHPISKRFKIVSAAPGKVWLDDLRVDRVE